MTTSEYIDLAHSYPSLYCFYDEMLPKLYNGEWTIDGDGWFPCVILDDDVGADRVKIVTRNQTHSIEPIRKVRRIMH